MTMVGVLGGRRRALVDPRGGIAPEDAAWTLDWWVGADDRWRVPSREPTVRQTLLDDVPVVRTAVRVPGGDAIERVYGVAAPGEPLVVEFENASPAPFVVAVVVRDARAVALEDAVVVVDGRPVLVGPRAPSRWSVASHGDTEVEVCSGGARRGPFPPTRDRAGRVEAAFLHPVPHRTTLRLAIVGDAGGAGLDLRTLASAEDAARGWCAQLERGLRVELPDACLAGAVRASRAELLLRAARPVSSGRDFAALEDWGFDEEAAGVWPRLPGRERRQAARRDPSAGTWPAVRDSGAHLGPELLLALRALLVGEEGDGTITLLRELPPDWRGQRLAVHDAPTRLGPVSYAVRWHGTRPALLWDAPAGVTLRAPGLDPAWSSAEPSGEALLAGAGTAV